MGGKEIKIKIEPEDINKTIAEAVINSAIGKELNKIIEEHFKRLTEGWEKPIERIVEDEMMTQMRNVVQEKYMPLLREYVQKKLDDKFVSGVLDKLWQNIEGRF